MNFVALHGWHAKRAPGRLCRATFFAGSGNSGSSERCNPLPPRKQFNSVAQRLFMSEIQFGCIDTKTGEFREGYVENGQMKYRRDPWWKRWFTNYSKNILRDEFVCTARGEQTGFPISVYKTINIVSGDIVSVWGQSRFHGRVDFDVEAFMHCDELVPI